MVRPPPLRSYPLSHPKTVWSSNLGKGDTVVVMEVWWRSMVAVQVM
jgi:hypothetical protein